MYKLKKYISIITGIYRKKQYQLVILITLIIATIIGTSLFYISEQLRRKLDQNSIDKSIFIIESIEKEAEINILLGDKQSLGLLTSNIVERDSNITDISFFNDKLRKVSGGKRLSVKKEKQWSIQKKVSEINVIFQSIEPNKATYYIQITYDINNSIKYVNDLRNKSTIFITLLVIGLNTVLFTMFYNLEKSATTQAKILSEANIAKTKEKNQRLFLANMSHEIRTPLNGIIGLLQLIEKTKLSKQQKTYAEAINTCSQTLLVVINDILDLSKIELGELKIISKPFDLKNATNQLVELFQGKAIDKGIKLELKYSTEIPHLIIGDLPRFNQIFYNIVGNAIKFTNKGHVIVEVKYFFTNNENGLLKITVTDSGIGIPTDKLNSIFNPFMQVENYDSRTYQGTGLGLAISQKLIKKQGGNIKVKSTVGKGSQFLISLPCQFHQEPVKEKDFDQEEHKDIANLNILLAEDNPFNQMVAIELLEQEKAIVEVAENGEEALKMVKAKDFDVILMDMQMPIMSGYEAMEKIRLDPALSHSKIIALTAHVNDKEIKKCLDAGANLYLSKPFEIETLKASIVELVNSA